jgi:hypothetical protein
VDAVASLALHFSICEAAKEEPGESDSRRLPPRSS